MVLTKTQNTLQRHGLHINRQNESNVYARTYKIRQWKSTNTNKNIPNNFFFLVALRPHAGHDLLNLEVPLITHNDASQSVGLLWTSDQLVAETST